MPWPDHAIAELAARQRTMCTTAQLIALGVRRRSIGRATDRGRLHPVHRGVHSLVLPAARPPYAAEQAALLACGPTAVLSRHSAAALHGLRLPYRDALIDVTVLSAGRRHHRGLVVHRTKLLARDERHRVQGLPVTSVARTLADISASVSDRQLAALTDQALRLTSRAKLLEVTARHQGRPGAGRLARLLDPARPSADTWSRREATLRASIRRAGLPEPESNAPLGSYVADLLWRRQRVIVEFDSTHFHSGPGAFHSDRTRHNDLAALAGHQILHVTEAHAVERVIVWITLALQAGGGW